MPATSPNTAATMAHPGVAGALLSIQLLVSTRYIATRLRLVTALPLIRLIHHHCIVQQLLAYARSEIGGLDVVRPHFLPLAINDV